MNTNPPCAFCGRPVRSHGAQCCSQKCRRQLRLRTITAARSDVASAKQYVRSENGVPVYRVPPGASLDVHSDWCK